MAHNTWGEAKLLPLVLIILILLSTGCIGNPPEKIGVVYKEERIIK